MTMKIDKTTQETLQQVELLKDITSAILTKTIKLENMNMELFKSMKKNTDILKTAIFDATEVQIPTSFVILSYKYEFNNQGNSNAIEKIKNDVVKAADSWLQGLTDFASNPSKFASGVMKSFDDCLYKFLVNKTLYFYYVDELTMRPVFIPHRPGYDYPFNITVQQATRFFFESCPTRFKKYCH